ncbi:uncharacterized protein TM35_001291060, partial [Trypanosoma theileri]
LTGSFRFGSSKTFSSFVVLFSTCFSDGCWVFATIILLCVQVKSRYFYFMLCALVSLALWFSCWIFKKKCFSHIRYLSCVNLSFYAAQRKCVERNLYEPCTMCKCTEANKQELKACL